MEPLVLYMLCCAPIITFIIGHAIGHRTEHSYWRSKGLDEYRTPVHSQGDFFYVVPEREYVRFCMAAFKPRDGLCPDCLGTHQVRSVGRHGEEIVETCLTCHPWERAGIQPAGAR